MQNGVPDEGDFRGTRVAAALVVVATALAAMIAFSIGLWLFSIGPSHGPWAGVGFLLAAPPVGVGLLLLALAWFFAAAFLRGRRS